MPLLLRRLLEETTSEEIFKKVLRSAQELSQPARQAASQLSPFEEICKVEACLRRSKEERRFEEVLQLEEVYLRRFCVRLRF